MGTRFLIFDFLCNYQTPISNSIGSCPLFRQGEQLLSHMPTGDSSDVFPQMQISALLLLFHCETVVQMGNGHGYSRVSWQAHISLYKSFQLSQKKPHLLMGWERKLLCTSAQRWSQGRSTQAVQTNTAEANLYSQEFVPGTQLAFLIC